MKFYYFCLKLEWTKLKVENIRLFVILEQKSGVFYRFTLSLTHNCDEVQFNAIIYALSVMHKNVLRTKSAQDPVQALF